MKSDETHSPPELTTKPTLILKREDLTALARDIVAKGAPLRFTAEGFSMSPFIKHGDIVTIAPTPQGSIGIGDIVAFTQPGIKKLLVHRVIRKTGEAFLISGDNMAAHDGLISNEHLIGQVKKIERGGQRIRLGLGPEKSLIAFMSRNDILFPLLRMCRYFFTLLKKRWQ